MPVRRVRPLNEDELREAYEQKTKGEKPTGLTFEEFKRLSRTRWGARKWLDAIRNRNRWTYQDVADMMNDLGGEVSASAVESWVSDKYPRTPTDQNINLLAKVLPGVTEQELRKRLGLSQETPVDNGTRRDALLLAEIKQLDPNGYDLLKVQAEHILDNARRRDLERKKRQLEADACADCPEASGF